MKIDKKELNKNHLELTVRILRAEALPMLTQAANQISTTQPIKGFRPGKAPYEIVKKEFGEPAIIQQAMDDIVNETLGKILADEKINPYGKIGFDLLPSVDTDEVIAYKAVITLMPTVTLGDWQKQKIKRQEVKISEEELNKAVDEMAEMLTQEEPVEREAQKSDKVIIDFETFIDGGLIEGGKASDFGLILGEGKMIPGFEEKLIGTKSGQKLEFTLNFPSDYHAPQFNGKPALFKINLKQILARIKPAINEELAKRVGVANVDELKNRLRENILKEKKEREEERIEIAAIRQLTDTATFSELPAEMVGEAAHDLVHEFEHTLAHQGMPFDQYLQSIGKKEADLIKEFEPRGTERIKSSMALGQLAENEKLALTNEEIDGEIAAQKITYANDEKALNDMQHPEYRRHVANSLINRKIINFLKQKIVE
ncbi:MAG TPA: trigger factor [Patescibacteria group bacterium]